jgi:formate C-acetyltransferase
LPLARKRAKVGCNWTALPGIEYSLQDVTRQSIIRPLLIALEEMAADPAAPRTMEEIWTRYEHHLSVSVRTMKEGFDWHMAHHAQNYPEIVLNLFCHGTVERGLDVAEGGVDIVNIAVDGVGLATVADSFAAIEQRVVIEKRLTLEELLEHMKNNWAGAERVRLMMRSSPRYGSGGSRGDYWAERIAHTFTDLVKSKPTPNGFNVIPGLFSHGDGPPETAGRHPQRPPGRAAHRPQHQPRPRLCPRRQRRPDLQGQCRGRHPARLGQLCPLAARRG